MLFEKKYFCFELYLLIPWEFFYKVKFIKYIAEMNIF